MNSGSGLFTLLLFCGLLAILLLRGSGESDGNGCLTCHQGILPFADGEMMRRIRALGQRHGDSEGCIVCHGGTPTALAKEEAHRGVPATLQAADGPQRFYPNPGNLRVAGNTCGQCHQGYARNLQKSLLGTGTEKVHRELCLAAFEKGPGLLAKSFGQNETHDEDGLTPVVGNEVYKQFMAALTTNPEMFADRIHSIPVLEKSLLEGRTETQCADCHLAGPSQWKVEDEHGSGCSACHVPYRNGGVYQGQDPTIDKVQSGKLLVHRLQGTASTRVTLPTNPTDGTSKSQTYSGILLDNCFTCHHDVREKTLNPIGTVMTHYGSRHQDAMGGSLLCQDCHTTIDMHGDGNIPLNSHAQMEVTCEDCHGTVKQAPWELPLGFGAQLGYNSQDLPRGLAKEPLAVKGARYEPKDGYLLTSRGNPFGNVVKDEDEVLLHSASGATVAVPILKWIGQSKTWKSDFSRQAMFEASAHHEKMQCLSCHADAAQPCFACHVSAKQPGTE